VSHGGQVAGLHLGGIIDAGRHAVDDQIDQRRFFALRRRLEQFDQFGGLLRSQRERRDAERGAFGNVGTVSLA
jgi:hypothetical protein